MGKKSNGGGNGEAGGGAASPSLVQRISQLTSDFVQFGKKETSANLQNLATIFVIGCENGRSKGSAAQLQKVLSVTLEEIQGMFYSDTVKFRRRGDLRGSCSGMSRKSKWKWRYEYGQIEMHGGRIFP